jgi:hypothetical protein
MSLRVPYYVSRSVLPVLSRVSVVVEVVGIADRQHRHRELQVVADDVGGGKLVAPLEVLAVGRPRHSLEFSTVDRDADIRYVDGQHYGIGKLLVGADAWEDASKCAVDHFRNRFRGQFLDDDQVGLAGGPVLVERIVLIEVCPVVKPVTVHLSALVGGLLVDPHYSLHLEKVLLVADGSVWTCEIPYRKDDPRDFFSHILHLAADQAILGAL